MNQPQERAIMRLLLETFGRREKQEHDAILDKMQKEIQTIEGRQENV